ncbi:MAG TPA: hydrogenase nickel incorporation protein HypB [bacterium]|nr:hydrogenase nickel incorporation protein HypB [bacterium]HPN43447.1 hydrogenase nickel incorporation protein HypB [bacterium]
MPVITVERKILEKNDQLATQNRQLFAEKHITVFNLLSSPGSGKTTLLEKLLPMLAESRCGVVEGDLQTDRDAQRIAALNVPVVQIVTNGGCHLDAGLVRDALTNLDLDTIRLLFIENVGNLVCPAGYDLGEQKKIVIISTTEGDDKPLKYTTMFRAARVCIINKMDLLPWTDFNIETVKRNALQINPDLQFFTVSAKTGTGMQELSAWFKSQLYK